MTYSYAQVIAELQTHFDEKIAARMIRIPKGFKAKGIKLGDLRALTEKTGADHALASLLLTSTIYEEFLLGILLAEPTFMTDQQLTELALQCESTMLVDSALIDLAAKSKTSALLMKSWVESSNTHLSYAGNTWLSSYFRQSPLPLIDEQWSHQWLDSVKTRLPSSSLPVQNAINNAVVMAALHVPNLHLHATEVAAQIGHILPLVARNSCNIQSASDYISRYITQPKFSRIAKLAGPK